MILRFTELRPYLQESRLQPDGGDLVVYERFRCAAMGPRRLGVHQPARGSELVEKYSVQVVKTWLGNMLTDALRHYLMNTE